MNAIRLTLFILAGCCLILSPTLPAEPPAAPFTPDKQFSAEQEITTKSGVKITSRIFVDNGKFRTEANSNGMSMVSIILPAEKKLYSIMVAQKMVMEMPLTDAQAQKIAASSGSGDAKFELVGPDTIDGVACNKYKMTSSSAADAFFWWISVATKAPVKMTSGDGSATVLWKNYKTGPQDSSLFELPAGYQVMQMPAGMGSSGAGAPGGGAAPAGQ